MRGHCCSDNGVFKPDERESERRLSDGPWYVNAKAECCGETNPSQLLVVDVPDEVFAPANSHAVEPCMRHGHDQVALRPYLCCPAGQRGLTQSMMEGANRARSRSTQRDNCCETCTERVIRRNHHDWAYLGNFRGNSSAKITDKHHPSFWVEGNRHRSQERAGAADQRPRAKVMH